MEGRGEEGSRKGRVGLVVTWGMNSYILVPLLRVIYMSSCLGTLRGYQGKG